MLWRLRGALTEVIIVSKNDYNGQIIEQVRMILPVINIKIQTLFQASCRQYVEQLTVFAEARMVDELQPSLYVMFCYARQERKIQVPELPLLRGIKRCSIADHIKNRDIREVLHGLTSSTN